MNFKELFQLVKQGEGQRLEFKLKSNHPDKICKEIIAFANSDGGRLLIGVGDNKEIIGLKFPNEDLFVLEKAFETLIVPKVEYKIDQVQVKDGKFVLIFTVPKSKNPPHYFIENENRTVYVRSNDQSIKASKEMKEYLKSKRKEKEYRFSIQQKEKLLLEYIDIHGEITLNDFIKIANISRQSASRTLVLLSLTNVLKIIPFELGDKFYLNGNNI